MSEELNILTYLYYYNGAGVAINDFNNDGLNDIYFTSNQGADKLFINQGGLKFVDVTEQSGINNASGWTTGVTHVDINCDGLMDIYACKVGAYKSIRGSNLLYINKGVDENGIPVFEQSAHAYGLDIVAFSTQAAFFDYDLDGDLDLYLLSHSVHPNRSYGSGENRLEVDTLAGDRLFENRDGKFVDVSKNAGIFQSKSGYGLGLAIGDLNKDGYPDIYVGNDFYENDYLYQNNGDKTFTELNSADPTILGHTSHYSMGNCIADVNNDGRADIMSLDMLPEDLITLKTSGVEDGYSVYNRFLQNGYAPQYMQNTLHLNKGTGIFSEVSFQSGIAATEWSWGILAADFDMDGFRDLYITNGILGATNDMDYINYISQNHIQSIISRNSTDQTLGFSDLIPEKRVKNYSFKNNRNNSFTDVTHEWFDAETSLSNGSAYADLDNDGDLDIVVNNVNQEAFIFQNTINDKGTRNYLSIKLNGGKNNTAGIGAKVEVFAGDLYIYEEDFPVKSYLSSVPNEIVIGLGENRMADSIRITWPNLSAQTLYKIEANQGILFDIANAAKDIEKTEVKHTFLTNSSVSIDFVHHEENTLDFDRDPLIPFALSNEGPSIAIADVNGDSLQDIFLSGAKRQASQLFIQDQNGAFISKQSDVFELSAISEDLDQVFFDVDNDLDNDLLVVSGGNEFTMGDPLKPRLYVNDMGSFTYQKSEFEGVSINASVVKVIDLENDGDLDVIIGSNALPGKFGEDAINYIYRNDGKGRFDNITSAYSEEFSSAGLITAVQVADLDGNGFDDLVAVGTWMPVKIFMNDGKSFNQIVISNTEGWWQTVEIADFDKDGDLDLVAGNWGLNSRLSASARNPIRLYRHDFDNNGSAETLITYYYRGQETFLSSMDELAKQMPFIRKKYLSYHDFAKAPIDDVLELKKSGIKKEVKVLTSCYFENDGSMNFRIQVLPATAQESSMNAIAIDDINKDGYLDILMVGNNYEISTQLGRLDASHGVLLLNDQSGFFKVSVDQSFNVAGAARDIKKIKVGVDNYFIISMNNDRPIFLKKQINE
ncbi:MAG TPA: VCBS repeat-containing protein [Cyclobacteriaceae bacterium]